MEKHYDSHESSICDDDQSQSFDKVGLLRVKKQHGSENRTGFRIEERSEERSIENIVLDEALQQFYLSRVESSEL